MHPVCRKGIYLPLYEISRVPSNLSSTGVLCQCDSHRRIQEWIPAPVMLPSCINDNSLLSKNVSKDSRWLIHEEFTIRYRKEKKKGSIPVCNSIESKKAGALLCRRNGIFRHKSALIAYWECQNCSCDIDFLSLVSRLISTVTGVTWTTEKGNGIPGHKVAGRRGRKENLKGIYLVNFSTYI